MTKTSPRTKRTLALALALAILGTLIIFGTMLPAKAQSSSDLYIQLTPNQGPAGTPISVYGLGFSGSSVAINWGDTKVATATVGMFGRISAVFMVPDVAAGYYTVNAVLANGNQVSASFTVTAPGTSPTTSSGNVAVDTTPTAPGSTPAPVSAGGASMALSATSGAVGKTVTVIGSGFGQGKLVTVHFNSAAGGTTYVAGQISSDTGTINVDFSVPMSTPGVYTVLVTSQDGITAQQSFTVTAGGPTGTQPAQSGGFWTTTNILIIVVVAAVAVVVPFFFFTRRRGGKKLPVSEGPAQPEMQPGGPAFPPTYPQAPPATGAAYGKQGTIASRYDQFASYGRSGAPPQSTARAYPSQTRTAASYSAAAYGNRRPAPGYGGAGGVKPACSMIPCRHCRQLVRADYNTCPYCHKRVK